MSPSNQIGQGQDTRVSNPELRPLVIPSAMRDLLSKFFLTGESVLEPSQIPFRVLVPSGQGRVLHAVVHCKMNTRPCPELEKSRDSETEIRGLDYRSELGDESGSDFSEFSHFNSTIR